MLKFGAGVLFGLACSVTLYLNAPPGVTSTARAAASTAKAKVEQTAFSICQRKVLDETHCYQDPKRTAKDCDAFIQQQCG